MVEELDVNFSNAYACVGIVGRNEIRASQPPPAVRIRQGCVADEKGVRIFGAVHRMRSGAGQQR